MFIFNTVKFSDAASKENFAKSYFTVRGIPNPTRLHNAASDRRARFNYSRRAELST